MNPYYDADGITIYHGDCALIVPQLGRFDLLLTDPKYGIGADKAASEAATQRIKANGKTKAGRGWKDYGMSNWDDERTPAWLIQMAMSHCQDSIIWGGELLHGLSTTKHGLANLEQDAA